MPPFHIRPDGLSAGAISLLDDALTLMWMNQVVIGAAAKGEMLSPQASAHIERLRSRMGAGVKRDRAQGRGSCLKPESKMRMGSRASKAKRPATATVASNSIGQDGKT